MSCTEHEQAHCYLCLFWPPYPPIIFQNPRKAQKCQFTAYYTKSATAKNNGRNFVKFLQAVLKLAHKARYHLKLHGITLHQGKIFASLKIK